MHPVDLPRVIASNRFSGSQRFGIDFFVGAQCIAPLRHNMTFIEPVENFHAMHPVDLPDAPCWGFNLT
jgi:hypothetical protein